MLISIFNRYKIVSTIILIILSIKPNTLCTQNLSITQPKYIRASEAYGFVLGQEFTLNKIKYNFPQYVAELQRVELLFNVCFGRSKKKIIVYLKEYLGDENFEKYDSELKSKSLEMLETLKLEAEIIEAFIIEVENRSKGNIPSPILETLLSFQFSDYPEDEFNYGFTKTYKTFGHTKSKGTDWQLKVPISWISQEAERPNIIWKFTSDYGSGLQNITMMVKEVSDNHILTNEEISFFLTTDGLKIMVPDGARYISSSVTTIDNLKSGVIECEQVIQNIDFSIKIRMLQFVFIYKNKIYSVGCTTSALSETINLDAEMKKYLPLFKLVANSIVVNQQYK
jgi:hypothetical protein